MTRKPHSTSLVLLLVCIFTFWWGISVLAQHDLRGSLEVTDQTAPTASAAALVVNETIQGGTHTYSGVYPSPPACNSFGSGIRYSAANGGHVSILLITEPSATACAQAAGADSGEPFTVSIKLAAGSNPAFDGVLLNGVPIPAQLVGTR
jgi:hypothetical protein